METHTPTLPQSDLLATLSAAATFPDAALIVRAAATIAEISGPLTVRQGPQWLTIGQDPGSHLHLRAADVVAVRYVASEAANAALELVGSDGAVVCKVSFRGTNPSKPERFDAARARQVAARFAGLG